MASMKQEPERCVYLMGIGGIGMVNVAALLSEAGWQVAGSDDGVYPPASDLLAKLQIPFQTPYAPENLPTGWPIIVGNALSRGHVEVEVALTRGDTLYSFPEFLRLFVLNDKEPIVVAGTHGKTTTAACIAHILQTVGESPSYLIGGEPINFPYGGHYGQGKWAVLEGDEYDSAFFDKRSKFLHYFPRVLTLGPIEFDHADIFSSLEDIKRTFHLLLRLLPKDGFVIAFGDHPVTRQIAESSPCRVVWVGESANCDWRLLTTPYGLRWEAKGRGEGEVKWSLFGRHNRLNGLMALATAVEAGFDASQCAQALESFRGVRRRLEPLYESEDLAVVDDFAHHPTAIASAIAAVRERFPNRRIIAVFEPRSNTTVRNYFQEQLADALAEADIAVVGTLHREAKIPKEQRLDLERLGKELVGKGRTFSHLLNDEIPNYLLTIIGEPTVVLFMSNGSFSDVQRRFLALCTSQEKSSPQFGLSSLL
jgi:UDP-N-acetylmuramate: L-alanyl-gamma-D-glutamyl-meso-diaminopimelate ligase